MRKIKIEYWNEKNLEGKEVKADTLQALSVLVNSKKPEEMPKGLDKFRLFNRLSKAFDKARDSKELILEETDYKFLKDTIESDIPSSWGMNQNISQAIENFLEAKEGE